MDICFDTSGLNRLHDDPEKDSIVAGLLTADQVLVTALNIREAVATEDAARRTSLIVLQRQLANGFRPLRTPIELLGEVTIARIQNRTSVTLTIDERSQGLWWALEEPEGLSSELQQESYEWKKNLEDQFTDAHRRARPNMKTLFTPANRPKSLAKLLRVFYLNPEFILPTVSAVYQKIAGVPLDMSGLFEVFSTLPSGLYTWRVGLKECMPEPFKSVTMGPAGTREQLISGLRCIWPTVIFLSPMTGPSTRLCE